MTMWHPTRYLDLSPLDVCSRQANVSRCRFPGLPSLHREPAGQENHVLVCHPKWCFHLQIFALNMMPDLLQLLSSFSMTST